MRGRRTVFENGSEADRKGRRGGARRRLASLAAARRPRPERAQDAEADRRVPRALTPAPGGRTAQTTAPPALCRADPAQPCAAPGGLPGAKSGGARGGAAGLREAGGGGEGCIARTSDGNNDTFYIAVEAIC